MQIAVINAKTCKPITNAGVDIWHCNAAGLYSDKSDQGTSGQTWLRGVQFTDRHGLATFQTIYPRDSSASTVEPPRCAEARKLGYAEGRGRRRRSPGREFAPYPV